VSPTTPGITEKTLRKSRFRTMASEKVESRLRPHDCST